MPVEFEPRGRARSCRDAPRGSSRLLARHGVRARVHRVPGGGPRRARLSRRRVSRLRLKSPEKSGNFTPTPRGSALQLDDRQTDRDPRDCMSSLFFSARKLEIHGTLVERTPPGAVLTSTRRRRFERSHRRESIPRVPARGRTNPAHANGEPRRRRTQLSEFEGRVH
jgi:hypothetical protein